MAGTAPGGRGVPVGRRWPFDGAHQPGITTPVARFGLLAAFNLVLHWMLDGYNRPDARPAPGRTDNRNLLGFKDGTATSTRATRR